METVLRAEQGRETGEAIRAEAMAGCAQVLRHVAAPTSASSRPEHGRVSSRTSVPRDSARSTSLEQRAARHPDVGAIREAPRRLRC